MTEKPWLCAALLALLASSAAADRDDVWQVPRTVDEVHVDGHVEEAAWDRAVSISLDVETSPADNVAASISKLDRRGEELSSSVASLFSGIETTQAQTRRLRSDIETWLQHVVEN